MLGSPHITSSFNFLMILETIRVSWTPKVVVTPQLKIEPLCQVSFCYDHPFHALAQARSTEVTMLSGEDKRKV